MKDIGTTPDGNRIVEMNQAEYRTFILLNDAVGGHGYPSLYDIGSSGFLEGFDFSTTFGVIRAYCRNKFWINEFQVHLDEMKSKLEKES